jgi:hypothetical protein
MVEAEQAGKAARGKRMNVAAFIPRSSEKNRHYVANPPRQTARD